MLTMFRKLVLDLDVSDDLLRRQIVGSVVLELHITRLGRGLDLQEARV